MAALVYLATPTACVSTISSKVSDASHLLVWFSIWSKLNLQWNLPGLLYCFPTLRRYTSHTALKLQSTQLSANRDMAGTATWTLTSAKVVLARTTISV